MVAVVMFGFGFALAPFYDAICRALGIGGKTAPGAADSAVTKIDTSRTVIVEFTGNAMAGLPWEFRPLTKKIGVHPGELTMVAYHVRNPAPEAVTGQAIPSVTPAAAAGYFKKIECFCFTQQSLAPGEAREMPVRFFVDPALPPEVHTITLSYGFFNTDPVLAKRYGGEVPTASSAAVPARPVGHSAAGG